jgi:hypothetical protein
MMFDWMVTGGVLAVNPASAVRGPKYVVKKGKTPVLTPDEARLLFATHQGSFRICSGLPGTMAIGRALCPQPDHGDSGNICWPFPWTIPKRRSLP